MGIISKLYNFTTGVISPSEVNADFDALYNELNGSIEAANISDGTITDDEMATAVKPVTRFDENFQDHVYSGLTITTDGLTASVAVGTAYVSGVRVVTSAISSNECDVSDTTYVDLSKTGAFSWNKNASPATNYMRLYSVITDDAGITSTTDERELCAVGADEIEEDACTEIGSAADADSVDTTSTSYVTCLSGPVMDVKDGDVLVLHGNAMMDAVGTDIMVHLALQAGETTLDNHSGCKIKAASDYQGLHVQDVYPVTEDDDALATAMMFRCASGTAEASERSIIVTRHRR